MTMREKENNKDGNALCIILVLCAIALLFHCINVPVYRIMSYSEWGEFIGGIFGTIIAGIACIYVYKTYISQKMELEKTNETAKKQQFETTFFNLIRIHKESLDSMQYTDFYSPLFQKIEENADVIEYFKRKQKILPNDYKEIVKMWQLQGEEAMLAEFKSNTDRNKLYKYFHSPWFNGIYMILKYLKDNDENAESFYSKFFYSQITRPEWWFLYAIFQAKENFDSEIEHFNNYVALTTDMHLFEYGYNYLIERNNNIQRDKIYEKNEF